MVAMTNHHVFRFHVAMHDVRLVCSVERCQHLNTDVDYLAEFERFRAQMVSQSFAIDEFSGQEGQSVHFTKLENGEDVWLIQRRSNLCFLTKALHASLVSRNLGREHFQSDGST